MTATRKNCILLVVALFMRTPWAMAYEEVEDLVDIFATDSAFIAVVDGKRNFSEAKGSGETILWQGAKGEIGAFLTSDRLLAVSTRSGQWNIRNLKRNEKKVVPEMLIGAHLVVMLGGDRIVAFGTHTDGFIQTRLPIGESVINRSVEGRVAAIVTPARAFGFSAYRKGTAEIRFKLQERVVSLKTTYNKIILRTSQRLITVDAQEAVWRQFDLK